ncbi:hypothetical protein TUM20984_35950 [Mycobacterium antarcticum]|nr:hypothetical protein TUM20984_35950 [Mycolicibacterium sp. TUM20984]
MGIRLVLVASAAAIVLVSCASESKPVVSASATVSKAEWQDSTHRGFWPFTVDDGVLTCHAPDLVTFTANGTEYALSDNARWVGRFPSVAPILVHGYVEISDERQPVPTPFNSLTDRGRELCP